MKKELLTIVDIQNDFMRKGWALPVPNADTIIRLMHNFMQQHGPAFDHVIATFDTHDPKEYAQSDEGKMFPIHCVKGTPGWELAFVPDVKYQPHEKNVFDMWKNPPKLPGGPGDWRVVAYGVAADFCVKYAVDGFLQRGYDVTVIHDLTMGIERGFLDVAKNDFQKYLDAGRLRLICAAEYTNKR